MLAIIKRVGEAVYYCVDCKSFSTKVKGRTKQGFDGYCLKIKKNVYQTSRACKGFILDALWNYWNSGGVGLEKILW